MELRNNIPKLTIVGAGPGDPELITLKAIRAIKSADVILYDALINEALLEYASPHSETIYVGKRRVVMLFNKNKLMNLLLIGQKVTVM